jgi:hypothetical protein
MHANFIATLKRYSTGKQITLKSKSAPSSNTIQKNNIKDSGELRNPKLGRETDKRSE